MGHAWHLITGTLSADRRRARVYCERTGAIVTRIHPFVARVVQPDCPGDQSSRSPR